MHVITALEAEEGDAGFYHILREDETGSLCGAIQEDNLFSGQVGNVLSRSEAEERGLQPCENCLTYTGEQ